LPGNCARELFELSKELASLQVCNGNKFFHLGFRYFVSDTTSGIVLGLFGPPLLALGPNCWMIKPSLKSESFDILDDLLGFEFKSYGLKTIKNNEIIQ